MGAAGPEAKHNDQGGVGRAIAVLDLPVPSGWFAVATAAELKPGRVRPVRIGGQELAVWRTADGTVAVADAWCPHLGAHLGHIGRVNGQLLECGFHGLRFDSEGRCRGTASGARQPGRARLRTWPSVETGGVVLTWFHPRGASPTWDPPEIEESGWTPTRWWSLEFPGHPVDVTENSVDVAHLGFLHGYDNVRVIELARAEGPVLRATYEMTRGKRASGLRLPTMRTHFEVSVHGLGVSLVDLRIETLGMRQRLFVLPTPLGDGVVRLRLGVSGWLRPLETAPAALRVLPAALAARAVREFTLLGLYYDVAQDRRIWTTKGHVPRPVLFDGDGPIGTYRRWAQQFLQTDGELSGRSNTTDGSAGIGSLPR